MKSLWLLIFALILPIAACQQQEATETGTTEETAAFDAAAIESQIRSLDEQFEQAMLAGDDERLTALYAPDAVVLPPGMARADGTEAIRSAWQQMFAAGLPTDVSIDTQTVVVSEAGDIAYQVGTTSMTIPGPDGSSITDIGKFVTIHEPTETGEWKITVDTWNSDAMPGAPVEGTTETTTTEGT